MANAMQLVVRWTQEMQDAVDGFAAANGMKRSAAALELLRRGLDRPATVDAIGQENSGPALELARQLAKANAEMDRLRQVVARQAEMPGKPVATPVPLAPNYVRPQHAVGCRCGLCVVGKGKP